MIPVIVCVFPVPGYTNLKLENAANSTNKTYWSLDQNDIIYRHVSHSFEHFSLRDIVLVAVCVVEVGHLLLHDPYSFIVHNSVAQVV